MDAAAVFLDDFCTISAIHRPRSLRPESPLNPAALTGIGTLLLALASLFLGLHSKPFQQVLSRSEEQVAKAH